MTLCPPNLLKLLTPLVVFAAVLGRAPRAQPQRRSRTARRLGARRGARPATPCATSSARCAPAPDSAGAYAALGDAYLARARETGDPGFYSRADRAFDAALRRDPRDLGALIGAGTLAGLRHEFARAAPARPRCAAAQSRTSRGRYTVIADAQIELGRYDDGGADDPAPARHSSPGLAAYARASYLRELTGDPAGAVAAMRLAASAGGAPRAWPTCRRCWATSSSAAGASAAARERLHARRCAPCPATPPALVGLARVDAAGGDLGRAAALPAPRRRALPLTGTLTLLAADRAGARPRRGRGGARRGACPAPAAAGGRAPRRTPRRCSSRPTTARRRAAVRLGRSVWRAAPSIRSADALGWALTRAGRPRAGLRWARAGAAARLARSAVPLPRRRWPRRAAGRAAAAAQPAQSRVDGRGGAAHPAQAARGKGGAPMRRAARVLAVLAVRSSGSRSRRPPAPRRTRSATSRSTTCARCASRRTASTFATCSTRPRSPPCRSAACEPPRCCAASSPRSRGA